MANAFDINDRTTWAWIDDGNVSESWGRGEGYAINPSDRGSFYQIANGEPVLHQCPAGQIYNPTLSVCDYPSSITEAAVYDWAVANRLVDDQR